MRTTIQKRGDRWRARWQQPDGKWRGQTFGRKIDAQNHLATVVADTSRGTYSDPNDARLPFGDYAASWLTLQVQHRQSTATTTESRLRRHVLPTFKDRQLGAVRRSEVQAWVGELVAKPLAPSTVEACYRLLATIFRSAVTDRLIQSSPCERIKLPSTDHAQVVPLPLEAVTALRKRMPGDMAAAVTLAAGAGLRLGEVLGLSVDRVDFLRRQVRVDRQLVLPKSGPPAFGPPKTAASNRTVPLPQSVVDALAAHLERHGEGPDRLIFHHNGRPVRRTRFWDWWKAATKDTAWPDAKFHDLRHHHASLLIAAGCSVKVVQAQLGHASATETLDTYSHLWPDDDERVRDAVDRAFRAHSAPIPRPETTKAQVSAVPD